MKQPSRKTSLRRLALAAAFCFALAMVSSGYAGLFDNADKIGNSIGGQAGQLFKAGAHGLQALAISEKDEDSIGQSVGVSLTTRYGLVHDDKLLTYVTMVGLTVAGSTPNPGGNYVFGILDTDEINAFSGPNGYIFITRSALKNMRNEAELAGVLAHEISHVCHHDGLHEVQNAAKEGALKEGLQASNATARFAALTDTGIDVITKTGYTQPEEFAADQSAVHFTSNAGYDPAAFVKFLQRLQDLQGASGGKIMSTHPGIGDRIKKVAKELKKIKNPGAAVLEDRFKKNVDFAR
jgi:predicted Zn-dependent protease